MPSRPDAFLAQARSDFDMFRLLLAMGPTVAQCHTLHYFAMAAEKLAKALIARSGSPVPKVHSTFHRICLSLRGDLGVLRAIGYSDPAQVDMFLSAAEPVFRQIEGLQPTADLEHPNVEYPWSMAPATGTPDWVTPTDSTFAEFEVVAARNFQGRTMMTLVWNLLYRWDRIP